DPGLAPQPGADEAPRPPTVFGPQQPPAVSSRVDLEQEVPDSIVALPAREAPLLLVPGSPDRQPVTTAVSCAKRAATIRPEETSPVAREGDSVRISGPLQTAEL